MWVAMQNGLSAREERAFAEIIRELEPPPPRVHLWHLCVLFVGWVASWIALFSALDPVAVAFGCFLAIAGFTVGFGWVVREATTQTVGWDRSMETRDKLKTLWRNLRP